ncbi:MAG: beta strand repeat-containing protein, partial [Azovibrio sp.]
MAVVCIPSKVSAQVTTPVTAGSGQTVLIPTNQSIHVPTGNAISATAGGIISGTGITAITSGNTAAVNSTGAGSLISLGGNTILTGARGGAWMDNGGLVKLGSGTIINVTGSSAGAGGIYVNNSGAPTDTFGSGITININGTHADTEAWIGAAVHGANGSASFDNLTVQGASADIGAMASDGGTLNLTNSNITVNGRIPGNSVGLWPAGISFTFVTNMGIAAHISSHLNISGTNVTVSTLDSGVAMGISVYDNSTLDLRDSTISMTGAIRVGTPIAAGLYMSNGANNVTVSNSRITTAGDNFQGVHLASGSLTADGLSVATAGSQSYGIHITTSATAPVNTMAGISNSDITTSGANSIGVRVNNVNSVTHFTNSTIAAQGANNIGIAVTTGGDNANLTMSGGTLNSTSTALQVQGNNATFGFSNGAVITSGNGLLLDVQGAANATLTASTNAKLTGNIQAATLNNANITLGTNATWTGAAHNVDSVVMSGGSLWNMSGDSDIASLSLNNSTVAFEVPHSPFKTLAVRGDYTSNNGLISL